MVLITVKKNDLVQLAARALTEEFYFRVLYLGNELYGIRIEEKNLLTLIENWPVWAKNFEKKTNETFKKKIKFWQTTSLS